MFCKQILFYVLYKFYVCCYERVILHHTSTICSPFSSQLITCTCSSVCIVFHRFFSWVALGDVDLYFSLMLARKACAVEEEIKRATSEYRQHNQSTCVTVGVTVTSISAVFLQKMSAATGCLCQVA
jgi:hypothetical protein